jgi:hypothetical protein
MICKVCQQPIEDVEGARAFKAGGRVRFHTHEACHELVRSSGAAIGQTIRQFVELRKPGLFASPAMRSVLAVIKELRS